MTNAECDSRIPYPVENHIIVRYQCYTQADPHHWVFMGSYETKKEAEEYAQEANVYAAIIEVHYNAYSVRRISNLKIAPLEEKDISD